MAAQSRDCNFSPDFRSRSTFWSTKCKRLMETEKCSESGKWRETVTFRHTDNCIDMRESLKRNGVVLILADETARKEAEERKKNIEKFLVKGGFHAHNP